MGGFGVALDALGGKCIFMSELEGNLLQRLSIRIPSFVIMILEYIILLALLFSFSSYDLRPSTFLPAIPYLQTT